MTPGARCTEDLREALEFGGVTDAGRGAMGLDGTHRCGILTSDSPGPLDRESLADRVRRGDALALAVARAGNAEHDRVDAVAVALGVLEALEDEQGSALTHDEAVGAGIERPCSGGGQRSDLAELHECRHAHVVVDPAGDSGIEAMVDEPLDGDAHRCQS